MSLFYLYRFKFAVKLQINMFENAIIGHFATRAVSGQFGLVVGKSTRPSLDLGLLVLFTFFNIQRFFT